MPGLLQQFHLKSQSIDLGYVAVTTMVFNDITLDLTTGDAFEYIFEAFLGMDYDSGTQTLTLDEDFFPPSLSEEGKEEHLMKKKYCKCFKMEKTKKKQEEEMIGELILE